LESIHNTLFVGKFVYHFESLPSTNAFAQELVSKSKPSEGTVISASFQTDGRGQLGSRWESSAADNIILSIVFYPTFLMPSEQFELNRAISLAVRDTLQHYLAAPVKIKWPNDIYVNEKKICGILIQNTLQTTGIMSSIVGIGININQDVFSDDTVKATSLILQTNEQQDLVPIQENLCQNIEARYLQLKTRKFAPLHKAYLSHIYQLEKWHTYKRRYDSQIFKGKIIDISDDGFLEILLKNNEIESFNLKEVQFL
jgi:BirA family biotin operon repressor/biotin-[acetyl-CoA-carboxylase] ligase